MKMGYDQTQVGATFKEKKMDNKGKIRSASTWLTQRTQVSNHTHMNRLSRVAWQMRRHKEGGKPKQMDRRVISGIEGMEVLQRTRSMEEEEEEEEGDAGQEVLRVNVYRLWFINSWAVSKSSRSSESLWIEAKKNLFKCDEFTNKPICVGVSEINNKSIFSTDQTVNESDFLWHTSRVSFAFQPLYVDAGESALLRY